jgi:prepilin-type N-terminal cleavage/methylation domain-containing protein
MILRKLRQISQTQSGFTLIEVLAALAITGIIGLGATMATVQVLTQGTRNSDYTTASRHAMNAIHWVSRDAHMAQTVTPDVASGFPLTLNWTEWDNSEHQVVYTIVDDRLMRSYSVDSSEPGQTLVAQYINPDSENTTCEFSDMVLTLRVTTVVGEGTRTVSVSRIREITPRPGL